MIGYAVGLTIAWVLLWDQPTMANIAGGLLVAAVLLVAFPLGPTASGERLSVRPLALLRLARSVGWSLLRSNLLVSREIVTPQSNLHTGIVACGMRTDSPKLLATVANILALSPGTMAVDATNDPPVLYVHVLVLDDVDSVRQRVSDLERRVIQAVGSAEARARIKEEP